MLNEKTRKTNKGQTWSDYMAFDGRDDNRNEDFTFFSYAWYMLNHGFAN